MRNHSYSGMDAALRRIKVDSQWCHNITQYTLNHEAFLIHDPLFKISFLSFSSCSEIYEYK